MTLHLFVSRLPNSQGRPPTQTADSCHLRPCSTKIIQARAQLKKYMYSPIVINVQQARSSSGALHTGVAYPEPRHTRVLSRPTRKATDGRRVDYAVRNRPDDSRDQRAEMAPDRPAIPGRDAAGLGEGLPIARSGFDARRVEAGSSSRWGSRC